MAPLALVLVTLIVAAVEIRLGHDLDRTSRITAYVLIALVLARQAPMLIELLGPRQWSSDARAHRFEHVVIGGH